MTDDADTGTGLPAGLQELLQADATATGALYNILQKMEMAAFEDAFADSLETLRSETDVAADELAAVVGLVTDADGTTVTDARVLSVHSLGEGEVYHTAEGTDTPDHLVYVPIRPEDCPPGTGGSVADLGIEEYREIVASMAFLRHQLLENEPDRYEAIYGERLARGLNAYAHE